MDSIDADHGSDGSGHLTKRLKSIEKELAAIDEDLQMASEAVTPPLSEEQAKELVTRNLAEIDAALKEPPEVVKHIRAKHIDKLRMNPVETPDGLRYEMTGQIRMFATGDPDDVLLEASLKRTCKQYTPISLSLRASLITRADEWREKGHELRANTELPKLKGPRVLKLAA